MKLAERAPGSDAVRSFERGPALIGGLDPDTAAIVLASACDIALVITPDGRLRDIAIGSEELAEEDLRGWIGRPLSETLEPDSRDKLRELLADVGLGQAQRWRHLNHRLADGSELPVRYRAVQLGAGRIVLLGRELRALAVLQRRLTMAEHAMARDYARITSAEGRYRMLFQTSSEPVLVADPSGLLVIEANPAMAALCRLKPKDLVGTAVLDLFDPASRDAAGTLLAAVRLTARGEEVGVVLRARPDRFRLSAMLFRQDSAVRVLVRLLPEEGHAEGPGASATPALASIVQRMPDGFVLLGPDRRVVLANLAFLEAVQLSIFEQAKGESIDRWLGRSEVDVDVIFAALRERGSLRQFATVLRGEYGSREEVEVSAVLVEDSPTPCIGLSLRRAGPRDPGAGADRAAAVFAPSRVTDLVGQVPLKSLVRDTTDQVEKRCIETALELTRNNRANAAEMLGLSRQSLYAKLRRHGLIASDEPDDGD